MVVGEESKREKGEGGHHTIIYDVTSIKAKISFSISRISKILENWKFTTFTTQVLLYCDTSGPHLQV